MGSAPLVPSRPTTTSLRSNTTSIRHHGLKERQTCADRTTGGSAGQGKRAGCRSGPRAVRRVRVGAPQRQDEEEGLPGDDGQGVTEKRRGKMEKHVFRIYDTNDDGYIDFPEFMVVFYIMSDGSPEEVLSKIFRVFDVNSDGTITQKELKRLIKD